MEENPEMDHRASCLNLFGSPEESEQAARGNEYLCKYCDSKFSSGQALGGHQNAHKRERAIEKMVKVAANAHLGGLGHMGALMHPWTAVGAFKFHGPFVSALELYGGLQHGFNGGPRPAMMSPQSMVPRLCTNCYWAGAGQLNPEVGDFKIGAGPGLFGESSEISSSKNDTTNRIVSRGTHLGVTRDDEASSLDLSLRL